MSDDIADRDTEIAMLMGMGATLDQAIVALEESGWNVDRALDQLYGGNEQTSEEQSSSKKSFRSKSLGLRQHDEDDEAIAKPSSGTLSSPTRLEHSSKLGNSESREKEAGCDEEDPQQREVYSTPSFSVMMGLGKGPEPTRRQHEQNRIEEPSRERMHRPTYPGAVAVGGSNTVGEAGESITVPTSQVPVTARLVGEPDEDYERLQQQLHDRDQQLQRVLAERENAGVAEVIETKTLTEQLRHAVSHSCSGRARWIAVVGAVVIMLAIVLGVVISPKTKAEPVTTTTIQGLSELLSSVSLDGGTALGTPLTAQNNAFKWLSTDRGALGKHGDTRLIQRYALVTLYYSTHGDDWMNSTGWLGDSDECDW